jgi:regulator of replication initiation timing
MDIFDQLDKALEDVKKEAAKLVAENEALRRERNGEVWYWQGDEEDHLESLTCPVLIEANDLRELLERSKKSEGGSNVD